MSICRKCFFDQVYYRIFKKILIVYNLELYNLTDIIRRGLPVVRLTIKIHFRHFFLHPPPMGEKTTREKKISKNPFAK